MLHGALALLLVVQLRRVNNRPNLAFPQVLRAVVRLELEQKSDGDVLLPELHHGKPGVREEVEGIHVVVGRERRLVLVERVADVLDGADALGLGGEGESEVEHVMGALIGVEDVVAEDVEGAGADLFEGVGGGRGGVGRGEGVAGGSGGGGGGGGVRVVPARLRHEQLQLPQKRSARGWAGRRTVPQELQQRRVNRMLFLPQPQSLRQRNVKRLLQAEALDEELQTTRCEQRTAAV